MEQNIKKVHAPAFKIKVAVEAIREAETPGQLASKYAVHAIQVGVWRKQALAAITDFFTRERKQTKAKDEAESTADLYQTVGQLKMENDWLKKKIGLLDT
jgi:hypothetical protein